MHALWTQIQVVHALVLRETRTRFGRHRLGYLWALFEPCIFVGMFGLMYYFVDRPIPFGLPAVPFLVTGFVTYFTFRKTAQQALHAIKGNKGLLFYPRVRPLDLVYARTVLETATHFAVFAIIMIGHALYQGRLVIDDLLKTALGLGLAAGLGAGLGLILCGVSAFSNTVERLVGPLMRPFFWMSALFFSTNELPTDAVAVVIYNPVLHAVELTREGWFPGYSVPQVSALYPAAWILVLVYFGLTLERVARRRLELT